MSMKDAGAIIEYGVPIDPKIMIEPPDPSALELEAGHPGLGDAGYVKRRQNLFALCRQHRLQRLGPTLIGKAAHETPDPLQVLALKRFSWFSIEFGLMEEAGAVKVFGAGILSSTGEIPFSLSDEVVHRPFVTDEVIATDYDPSRMQDK